MKSEWVQLKKRIKFSILNDPSWIMFRLETTANEFSALSIFLANVLRDLRFRRLTARKHISCGFVFMFVNGRCALPSRI